MGLPLSLKIDSNHLMKDNRAVTVRRPLKRQWERKKLLGGATFLSFPLLFQRSTSIPITSAKRSQLTVGDFERETVACTNSEV